MYIHESGKQFPSPNIKTKSMDFKSMTKVMLFGSILMGSMQSCSPLPIMEDVIPQKEEEKTAQQAQQAQQVPQAALVESDSLVLVKLFNALDGENWKRGNNWLKKPARFWKGVTIKRVNGKMRVTQLRLGSMHLNGKIPEDIKNLTALTALELCYNANLTGEINEEVYELENLITLNLRFTGITGTLSPSIGKLTQLDTLDLWTSKWTLEIPGWDPNPNLMSGTLPKELGKLKNLRFLRLGRQAFTGDLPAEMGEMESLTFLDIAQCRFTGGIPPSFGQLKKLEVLFASENDFSKPLPQELGDAESLKELFVFQNRIPGEIPASLCKLKQLTHLSLEDNQLTGPIPDLSSLSELSILYLQNNRLSGSIPASIGSDKHPKLICADLSNNNLTGNVPSRESHTWNGGGWLTEMRLKGNRLTGVIDQTHLNFEEETRERFLPQQDGYGFDNLK